MRWVPEQTLYPQSYCYIVACPISSYCSHPDLMTRSTLRPSRHPRSIGASDLIPWFQSSPRPKPIRSPIHHPRLRRHSHHPIRQRTRSSTNERSLPRAWLPLSSSHSLKTSQAEIAYPRWRPQHSPPSSQSAQQDLRWPHCSTAL